MDSLELLVHVSAPGTIHDDKGVLALAKAVTDFKAAKVTRVMDQDSDTELPSPPAAQRDVLAEVSTDQNGLKRRAASLDSTAQENSDRESKRSKLGPNGYLNPPYRRPWRGRLEYQQVLETPLPSIRPQTAPEGSIGTIQVPRTNTERRRAYSDSFQTTNVPTGGSSEPEQVDESSEGRVSSPLAAKQVQIVQGLSQTSLEDKSFSASALSSSAANTMLPHRATPRPRHSSSTMTASPSQPMEGIDGQRPYSSQPAPDKSPSIVTLSSGSSIRQPTSSPNIKRKRQSRNEHSSSSQSARSAPVQAFPGIDLLPAEVVAPQPETGSMGSNGHVSRHLQDLLDALPLAKLFRPIKVRRDIKNLERGHWLMEITVAPDSTVQRARTSPSKEQKLQRYTDRFSAATAQERVDQFWEAKAAGKLRNYDYGDEDAAVGLWTEDEFIDFWNGMSKFIRDGKAGWAVRMVRDEPEENPPRDNEFRHLRVRIFTWGEIIPHLYLAIWICSDKKSIRIPMRWVAGDGTSVVAMSGKKKYGGTLKPFVRKGPREPKGQDGCWGLSDD